MHESLKSEEEGQRVSQRDAVGERGREGRRREGEV